MARFGYIAVQKGYATQNDISDAINAQWNQEWRPGQNGVSDKIGEVLIRNRVITKPQRDEILKDMLMEPNISWGKGTIFGDHLDINKTEKQLLGEYVGRMFTGSQYEDVTILLSGSTTIYYVFRGLVKSDAEIRVCTINAAILSAYPSVESSIREVSTIWNGEVDLYNAIIKPSSVRTAREILPSSVEGITSALLSCVSFDNVYGPVVSNRTARLISSYLLESTDCMCYFIIDHSKIRNGTCKDDPKLLFRKVNDWNRIRRNGNIRVIIDIHPKMPPEIANDKPTYRQKDKIEKLLNGKNVSKQEISEVMKYQDWSMRIRDIIHKEVIHPHQKI